MNISALWIRRPVFTIVVALIPAFLGIFGITQLQIRDLPEFDIPVIQVVTLLTGAPPAEVNDRLTVPLEQALATVNGIDTIVSTSNDGISTIQVTFLFGKNSVEAANQIQAALDQVADNLPSEALRPQVTRLSLDDVPVVYLSLSSNTASDMEINDAAQRLLTPQLATIPGVGSVQLIGGRDPVMWVRVDPARLQARGADVQDALAAIRQHNALAPVGNLKGGGFTTGIGIAAAADPVADIAGATVRRVDGQSLPLREVADVSVGGADTGSRVLIDGHPAVAIGVLRQSTANTLDLVDAVRAALPGMRALLPSTMKLDVVFDTTVSIRASLVEIRDTLVLAIVLVILVVLAFLASFRSALITLVTIPLSLLFTVAFMFAVGFSFNTFTLLAFILAIGLVVDDAIIDVENVQRHIDEGLNPVDAAFVGSAEIGFAVVATTITLAALYVPIGLIPGLAGSLFREFGLTLAVAVLASGAISRTLSPMMCSRLLRPQRASRYGQMIDRLFGRLSGGYRSLLLRVLDAKFLCLAVGITLAGLGFMMARLLPGELAPNEDAGYIVIRLDGPTNATVDYLIDRTAAIERITDKLPEKAGSLIILGVPEPSKGYAFILLTDWSKRERRVGEITAEIQPQIERIPGIGTAIIPTNPLSGGQSAPLQLVIKSTGDFRTLAAVAERVRAKASALASLRGVDVDLSYDLPQLTLRIDRNLAGDLGVSPQDIASTLNAFLGGIEAGRFASGGSLYSIRLALPPDLVNRPSTIGEITLKSGEGTLVPLSTFVSWQRTVGADFLPRFNQLAAATISATPAPGISNGTGLAALESAARSELLPGMTLDYAGQSRQMREMSASNGFVFMLGLAFVFLTLAAQFESFRDPFIVLLVVPLSIAGALASLVVFGGSINVYSGIGLLTLIGLIAKHGILITEFANQLREAGQSVRDAVSNSAERRLRPILMTTLAMIMGAVPLVLSNGAGAQSRHDIGLVIIGGLILGTTFSLFVVPIVFELLTKRIRPPLIGPSAEAIRQLETTEGR